MASFPSLSSQVVRATTTEEENGELDQSLQQMLKAIADERNRLNIRQEISGLATTAQSDEDGAEMCRSMNGQSYRTIRLTPWCVLWLSCDQRWKAGLRRVRFHRGLPPDALGRGGFFQGQAAGQERCVDIGASLVVGLYSEGGMIGEPDVNISIRQINSG
ncbi:unnamed protein product [Boreogadus saida]